MDILIGLGGRTSGYVAIQVDGRDDNGATLRFTSGLQPLSPVGSSAMPTATTFVAPGIERFQGGDR
jgi:hypothetical protein